MMILANAAIASWGAERGITLLHRTQDVGIPREYAGVWNQPHDIARVVKALAPAHLEPVAKPHAGIAVPAYSPVTSPLRRYPDLVNEAQVIHYLTHGTPRWSREEVEAMLPLLGARLDAAGQVQRFRPRYWKLFYIRQQGDKTWHEAVVTEENDAFVTISLPEVQIFVRGRRSTFGDKVYPGQHFNVRLGKVHPLNNEIQIVDAMEG
jgi:exoribonuclease-2